MSFRKVISLSAAVVGTSDSVDWTGQVGQGPGTGVKAGGGYVRLYNDTGCALDIDFSAGHQERCQPGGWPLFQLRSGETRFVYVVQGVIHNAPLSDLIVIVYEPGEPVPPAPSLGNSPIGLNQAVTSSVTQVIQDGQPSGQTIVESTPTATAQTILWTTDGLLIIRPSGGNNAMELIATDATEKTLLGVGTAGGGFPGFFFFDNVGGDFIIDQMTKNGVYFKAPIIGVGNQPTAGSFGVPVIVAQARRVAVAANVAQTILSYTPAANGTYRLSGWFATNSGVAGSIDFHFTYADPLTGPGDAQSFAGAFQSGVIVFNGSEAALSNDVIGLFPVVIEAQASTAIVVTYHNPAGTVNDVVTVIIERVG